MNKKSFIILGVFIAVTGVTAFMFNNCSSSGGGSTPPPNPPGPLGFRFTMNASINGQDGWFADPSANFNEKVMNMGATAHTGVGVWFINNTVTSSAFGNQPQSPAFTKASGESTVRSLGGGDSMVTSFWIRTVSGSADGTSFTLSFSPTAADRHNYLRIINDLDANGGFRIFAIDGVNLNQVHSVATNIARGLWQEIKVINTNLDGPSNDIVDVYINGVLVHSHTTWEDWRRALPATTLAVTRIMFRMSIQATTDDPSFTLPQGFYIDDFRQTSFDSSNPAVAIEDYSAGFEP